MDNRLAHLCLRGDFVCINCAKQYGNLERARDMRTGTTNHGRRNWDKICTGVYVCRSGLPVLYIRYSKQYKRKNAHTQQWQQEQYPET